MNIKIIKEAPNRFPTKISGLLLIIEFIPILNSGTEVSIPKTKNDIAKGEILNPSQELDKEKSEKVLILYDKSDESIDYNKIENYSFKNNIKTIEVKNIGHLSFSKLSEEMKNEINNWLSS